MNSHTTPKSPLPGLPPVPDPLPHAVHEALSSAPSGAAAQCRVCGLWSPLTHYTVRNGRRQSVCVSCRQAHQLARSDSIKLPNQKGTIVEPRRVTQARQALEALQLHDPNHSELPAALAWLERVNQAMDTAVARAVSMNSGVSAALDHGKDPRLLANPGRPARHPVPEPRVLHTGVTERSKRCTKCLEVKPTTEFSSVAFARIPPERKTPEYVEANPYPLPQDVHSWCRACTTANSSRRSAVTRSRQRLVCFGCGEDRPRSDFPPRARQESARCLACRNAEIQQAKVAAVESLKTLLTRPVPESRKAAVDAVAALHAARDAIETPPVLGTMRTADGAPLLDLPDDPEEADFGTA